MRIDIDPAGWVRCEGQTWRCALGRGGIRTDKAEGDGATPAGDWPLGRVFYRPDRLSAPETGLMTIPLTPDFGWCDDPAHPDYNRLISLPHPAHHENLWREDAVYDIIVELEYNTGPVQAGRGSAIFMHVAKPDYSPTEGCIALNLDDLLVLLRCCNKADFIHVPA